MFVGKTRIVPACAGAVRVLEKFNSVLSKVFFEVASSIEHFSLTTEIKEVKAYNSLIVNIQMITLYTTYLVKILLPVAYTGHATAQSTTRITLP